MSKEKLKKELPNSIDNVADETILNSLKEDIVAYQKTEKAYDDLSDLTPAERAELEELANEDPEKDTISFDKFKKEINEWVSKL